MDLDFILSLDFDQVNLDEKECLGVKVLIRGRIFNVNDGKVSSGIFIHKQNEQLLIVIYNGYISIGLLTKKQVLNHYIELARANTLYDELCREVMNRAVEKYTK